MLETIEVMNRRVALEHLVHDVGVDVASQLTKQHGAAAMSRWVHDQRIAGVGQFELDLTSLQLTSDQLTQVAQHQQQMKTLESGFLDVGAKPVRNEPPTKVAPRWAQKVATPTSLPQGNLVG